MGIEDRNGGEEERVPLDEMIEDRLEGKDLEAEDIRRLKESVRNRVQREVDRELSKIRMDRERKSAGKKKKETRKEDTGEEEFFLRFNRNFRFQHMVLFSSVIILVFTGLPLKFPDFVLSRMIIALWGGVKNSTLFHRVGASMLIYFMIHHFFYTIFSREGRRDFIKLIPITKDGRDLFLNVRHFLGKTPERPRFDRFSYIEKFDYWAVYWGCIIMIGSGLILWFEEVAMRVLPKYWIDIAHEAHSDEALLATLAIVIWHFYNVHFNPDRFPGTLLWWHGRMSKEEMLEEHPLEYDQIMSERKGGVRGKEEQRVKVVEG
jgi:cytochrome b subunit of formate dehydrogenase